MKTVPLLALSTAALLVLAGCYPVQDAPVEVTPVPPAEPATAIGNSLNAPAGDITLAAPAVSEPSLRATTLGTLNGCRIDRVIVDGNTYVMASAVAQGRMSSSSAYGYAACDLEPVS